MAEEYGIGIKLNFDTSQLKRLPSEMQQALGRLSQVFGDSQGPGAGRFNAGVGTLLSKGPSNRDVSEMRRNFRAARRALEEHYQEEAKLIERNAADNAIKAKKRNAQTFGSEKDLREELKYIAEGRRMALSYVKDERRRMMRDLEAVGDVPGAPPGGGGGGRGGRGFFGSLFGGAPGRSPFGAVRMLGGLAGTVGIPLGLGAIAAFGVRQSMKAADQAGDEFDLARRVGSANTLLRGGTATRFGQLYRDRLMTPEESTAVGNVFATTAGMGNRSERDQAAMAMASGRFGLGLGVGAEKGAAFFGGTAQLGVTDDKQSQRDFAIMIGEAIVNSRMRGREGEMIEAVHQFTQMGLKTMMQAPSGTAAVSMMTKLAMANPDSPGAKGALGMQILGAAHGALAGTDLFPGMGTGLQPFLFSAIMKNQPGMSMDEMVKLQQRGIFGTFANGKSVPAEVMATMQQMGIPLNMQASSFNMPVEKYEALQRSMAAPAWGYGQAALTEEQRRQIGESGHRLAGAGAIFQKYEGKLDTEEGRASFHRDMDAMIKANPTEEGLKQAQADIAKNLNQAFTDLIPVVVKTTQVLADMTAMLAPLFSSVAEKGRAIGAAKDSVLGTIRRGGNAVNKFLGGSGGAATPKGRIRPSGSDSSAPIGRTEDDGSAEFAAKRAMELEGEITKNHPAVQKAEAEVAAAKAKVAESIRGYEAAGGRLVPATESFKSGKVEFDPVVVILKNEQGETVGTATSIPRAPTRSGVAE